MKVAGLNLDIIWKNKTKNFEAIERGLQNQDADLFLLPEMFSTGFCMEASEVSDRHEESFEFLKKISKEKNAAFCGSAPVEQYGKYYNRMYFVQPDGETAFYNKRHLFSFSGKIRYTHREKTGLLLNIKE